MFKGCFVIIVSGLVGFGIMIFCRNFVKYYGFKYIYVGFIFRQMVKEMGMIFEEFQKYVEFYLEIDREIDRRQIEVVKECNVVIEGCFVGWMVKNVDLKIWFDVLIMECVKRVVKREGIFVEEVFVKIVEREKQNRKRYLNFYGIDIEDKFIYDLIINMVYWGFDGVFVIVKVVIDYFFFSGDVGEDEKEKEVG